MNHDLAENFHIPSGSSLIINNRTTVHGLGYPAFDLTPWQKEEDREYWRVMVKANDTNTPRILSADELRAISDRLSEPSIGR